MPGTDFNSLLDLETASRLRRFFFRAPSRVRGRKAGIHKSYYRGISPDFMEYKEYNRGDELRQVDWRLYGRHDRLYVRKFEDEVNLDWCVLVDTSASMGYGAQGATKLDYARRLAATLSYLLLRQGDAVGAGVFSGEGVDVVPPRAGNPSIAPILDMLGSASPAGGTALSGPVARALEVYRRDSAFVIVSDLLTDEADFRKCLQMLNAAGRDAVFFHVLHEDETEFSFRGSFEFEDMESGRKVIVDAGEVRNNYIQRMRQFMDSLRRTCHEYESRYVFAPASRPVEEPLILIADK
ncbi:MAG TPA: DUF58 domain-containing protein [Thermodesulfobacteriota bacterium]|nr:DUF58 domain-containing protein [Thermodesulfobacteriota bacterium]